MTSNAKTPDEYFATLPEERREPMLRLREVLKKNLPRGFEECMGYGMLGFSVPHRIYPKGYHCDPKLPLPFVGMASQKNFISLYHMGLYADKELMEWFTTEYPKHTKAKLDMGKSCIRFRKSGYIPYELIGQLAKKMTPADWINLYEMNLKR